MSYKKVLVNEIMEVFEDLRSNKKNLDAKFIAKHICNLHKDEIKPGSIFSEYNTFQNVRNETQRCISKLAGDAPSEDGIYREMVIPGFNHAQYYYTFNNTAVHIDNMTTEQFDEKMKMLEKASKTMIEHRDELAEYKQMRFGKSAA